MSNLFRGGGGDSLGGGEKNRGSYLEFKFITFHYQLDNSLIYSLLTANCIDISLHVLINCSTFKDVILHYYPLLSIQSGVHLIDIFNNSN